jgi:hypothetical protein
MKILTLILILVGALTGLSVALVAPACSSEGCSQSCSVTDDCPWTYHCENNCCTNYCEDYGDCYHCPYVQCGGPYCDTEINECKCEMGYDGGTDGGGDGGC